MRHQLGQVLGSRVQHMSVCQTGRSGEMLIATANRRHVHFHLSAKHAGSIRVECTHLIDKDGAVNALAVRVKGETVVAAVSVQGRVFVYAASFSVLPFMWRSIGELDADVNCLDWSHDASRLIAGGASYHLWDIHQDTDSILIWHQPAASPVSKIVFSPDSKFFASLAENDRFLKVWYKSDQLKEISFDFVYISHPIHVVSFEWRYPHEDAVSNSVRDKPSPNALISVTRDSTARIWVPTSSGTYPFAYSSSSGNNSSSNINSGTIPSPVEFQMRAAIVPDVKTTIHWIQPYAVSNAFGFASRDPRRGLSSKSKISASSSGMGFSVEQDEDGPDLLFGVTEQGGIQVWGITGLMEGRKLHHRRIPKVMLMLKTVDGTLSQLDFEAFQGRVEVSHIAKMDSAIYFPPQLSILAHSPSSGLLNVFSLNLDEFLGAHSENVSRFQLDASWCGHMAGTWTREFFLSPNLGLIASVASDSAAGDVAYFSCANDVVNNSRVSEGLDLITRSEYFTTSETKPAEISIAWVPNYKIAIVSTGFNVFLDYVGQSSETSDSSATTHISLQQASLIYPITLLQAVLPTPSVRSSHPNFKIIWVLGLCGRDGRVIVWQVRLWPETGQCDGSEIILDTSLSISHGAERSVGGFNLFSLVHGQEENEDCGTIFGTLSSEGILSFWGLAVSLDKNMSTEVGLVSRGQISVGQGVSNLRVDMFGSIAAVRRIDESDWQVSVWRTQIEDNEYTEIWKKKWSSEVVMADITVTSDGQSLIAAATRSGVDVFCQNRSEAFDSPCEWIPVSEMTLSWEDEVKCIGWLPNGSLAVSLASRGFAVFNKWKDTSHADSLQGETARLPSTLQRTVARINGRLPDYHPSQLLHYVIWAKYELVQFILSVVHGYVRLMSQGGRIKLMREIPSTLWKFFEEEGAAAGGAGANYDALFLEEGEQSSGVEIGSFTKSDLDYLVEHLTEHQILLPYLSAEDQTKLFAIMNSFVQVEQQKRSIDENGARFVFFARLLLSALPIVEGKAVAVSESLSTRDISWAFYSDSQDFLVDFTNQSFNGKPLWKDVRSLGMGFWLRNSESLRRQIESIARNQYMSNEEKNPVDCALFYICLRKKNVLLGLWKLASSHPEQGAMLKFLGNDFAEERWQKAAVKNAFALLGKQRYEYAVAFFLLADRLKDAVNVCLKHLKDLQLAIVLCRVFEGDESATLADTLKSNILPEAFSVGDRYLISMVYTLLKEKEKALKATMMPLKSFTDIPETTSTLAGDAADPPLLVIHNHLSKTYKAMRVKDVEKIPAGVQFDFLSSGAVIYESMACPGLALDMYARARDAAAAAVIERTTTVASAPSATNQQQSDSIDWGPPVSANPTMDLSAPVSSQPSGGMDWGAPVSLQPSGGMDWGAPVSSQPSGGMDWGAPVSSQPSGGMDWGAPVSLQPSGGMDWGAPVSSQSAGGMDWGEPVARKPANELDEYEAFKNSMKSDEPDELELLERELELAEQKNAPAVTTSTAEEPTVQVTLDTNQMMQVSNIIEKIRFQQWKMAIRMIHALYKPIAVVSLNMDILSVDPVFKGYFAHLNTGLRKLSERVEMPLPILDAAITTRFKEMDAFVAFVELPCLSSDVRSAKHFSAVLVEGSSHLCSLVFGGADASYDAASVDPVIDYSKRMLWSVIRWYEKDESVDLPISVSVMSQTASTAFLALTISYLRCKDFRSLWWVVGLSDRFFEVLVGGAKKKNLKPLILDLLTQREPIIQPDSDSEGDDSDDDYYGEVSPEKALLAETLLASIALQHIGLDFKVFVKHMKEGGAVEDSHGFLSENFLSKLSSLLHQMHAQVRASWSGSLKFKISKLGKYLLNKYSKGVWALIKRTANIRKLASQIISGDPKGSSPDQGIEAMSTSDIHSESANASDEIAPDAPVQTKRTVKVYDESCYELVFRTKDIIGTFAINPLNNNCFAVATHDTIVEFDLDASLHFYSREEVLAKRRESVDDLAIKSSKKSLKTSHSERLNPENGDLRRNLSFDSLQRAVKDSMMDLRRRDSELDSGRRIQRNVVSVSSLEAHPTLNYYLAGIGDGNSESIVKLYQFGQKGDLVAYSSGSSARITKCRFDPFGGRFGCSDAKGELRLWKFDATQQSLNPTQVLQCHSAITNDFCFVNSSTILATAGVSSNGSNICLWDTLLPQHKARVKSFHVTEGGAYSIAHSHRHQAIISGGKKGDILIFDVRQMRHRKTFRAHESTVKSLFVDESHGLLISGATGGDIKVWDLEMLGNEGWNSDESALSRKFPAGHSEKASGMSTYGVMQISVNDDRIYTCGADGSLSRCKV
ncbi:hypothetical protein CcCBS67573_g04853 [Chytriomyces confervae]|uniref:RAVE complex protein Rav1 C-terminal domain-containing protein n=1 Tax=Chytriomyces confervae TaxID=246404 RepID=A0A507FE76_9FUNG|nr:hypothetical protein CcCBS67573_g04853 [Chytriomyces confervae]